MSEIRNSSLLRKITIVVVIYSFVMVSFVVNTAVALDGSGTEQDPWRIKSLADFDEFAADVHYWNDYTRLETDVNLAGRVYERPVIGDRYYDDGWVGTAFTGVFDGNGHTISNFTCDSNDRSYIGLFGYVDDRKGTAVIKNLGLIDANIDAGTGIHVGSLVGRSLLGTISGCYVKGGSVSGNSYIGGLVGTIGFEFIPAPPTPPVIRVTNCYAIVDVTGDGNSIGGLIGRNYYLGISECYAAGNTVSSGNDVGGLVGYNCRGIVINCYSAGNVEGENKVGGLVGFGSVKINNCYSTGSIVGDSYVGGLVGWDGCHHGYCGTINNSYWDIETGGEYNMCGYQEEGATGCDPNYGKMTSEMQMRSTFTDAGWDFVGETVNGPNDIWDICEGTNYPRFFWQIPAADFLCPDGVDFIDYSFFTSHWQEDNCDLSNDCEGTDLDQLGTVDANDLIIFMDGWLKGAKLISPLGQASNPNPFNGAIYVNVITDLSWTAGSGATSHDVYFGTSSPGIFQGNQTETTFDPGIMAPSTTYYWRIDEIGAYGTTIGNVWRFTTVDIRASNPNPTNGALGVSTTADLTWTAGAGATSHDVYFGTNNPPTFIGNQITTTFEPGTMDYNTTYYWRIDEVNSSGTTTGMVWSFTIVSSPPPPPPT